MEPDIKRNETKIIPQKHNDNRCGSICFPDHYPGTRTWEKSTE
jgi:hypothetical protein